MNESEKYMARCDHRRNGGELLTNFGVFGKIKPNQVVLILHCLLSSTKSCDSRMILTDLNATIAHVIKYLTMRPTTSFSKIVLTEVTEENNRQIEIDYDDEKDDDNEDEDKIDSDEERNLCDIAYTICALINEKRSHYLQINPSMTLKQVRDRYFGHDKQFILYYAALSRKQFLIE